VSEGHAVTERRAEVVERPVTYAYRPSALGSLREFSLSDDGIDWVAGVQSGHIPYRDIFHVRMSYRPITMQPHRFVTELWAKDAPKLQIASTSWKSVAEQQRLDQPYSAFVRELHHHISATPTSARLERGSSPLVYWPSLFVFIVVALGLAALIVRTLQFGAYSGAALAGAFLALFLWQGGNFIQRNRPGIYGPDLLPKDVMPRPP
jgi:hypothetical protein